MEFRPDEERRVLTWPQLRRRYTAGQIRAQLDAGRWRRWGRAIVLHNGPLSRTEQCFVARAHGAPGSILTAFTALELVGLQGWSRPEIHVLTPHGARNSGRCPFPVRFLEVGRATVPRRHRLSATHIPRQAVVVAAGLLASERAACGLVIATVQQRISAVASIRGALELAPTVRHRKMLRLVLDDVEQGADALSEIDFVRLCRRHRLPAPEQQAVRRAPGGRRRYLDASWRRPDGRTLAVEVDGAVHLSQRRWWDDQARQNEIVLADTVLLRYPSVVIRTDPAIVADQLRRGLLPG